MTTCCLASDDEIVFDTLGDAAFAVAVGNGVVVRLTALFGVRDCRSKVFISFFCAVNASRKTDVVSSRNTDRVVSRILFK